MSAQPISSSPPQDAPPLQASLRAAAMHLIAAQMAVLRVPCELQRERLLTFLGHVETDLWQLDDEVRHER